MKLGVARYVAPVTLANALVNQGAMAHSLEDAISNWEAESGVILSGPVRTEVVVDYQQAEQQILGRRTSVTRQDLELYWEIVVPQYLDHLRHGTTRPPIEDLLLSVVSGKPRPERADRRVRGRLRFIMAPSSTSVRIDGELLRAGSLYVVNTGQHEVAVEKPNYERCLRIVDVPARDEVIVSCALMSSGKQTKDAAGIQQN